MHSMVENAHSEKHSVLPLPPLAHTHAGKVCGMRPKYQIAIFLLEMPGPRAETDLVSGPWDNYNN